ncbi:lipocalin-like domain-containing protein [Methylobacterium sp. W2]|uniref:lipocalin-like domain-containing protein n=1 Tax=Methylobacterium sp. W2 TaxID=2598107 RepID=UPI001D0C380F|nr:lipocalin-like domain-containing protein [Methylobacterium sp. W2]
MWLPLLLTSVLPGSAQTAGDARITGLWKLVSYEVEVRSTGKTIPVMGAHPTGFAYFTPEGRVFFNLTGEDRKPAVSDKERAALLDTMVSYTGRFTVTGNQWTAKLDAAWNPAWVGTEQTRSFEIDGVRLRVLTPWRVMPNWAEEGETRSIVTFKRATDS